MAGMTGLHTLDLLGSGWKLESMDGKHVVEHASLPGQALQMLHDAGLVDDPLHGYVHLWCRVETRVSPCLLTNMAQGPTAASASGTVLGTIFTHGC